ncbi:hypothetical protein [Thalassobius sp. I31.1]|uniref:hypothetical protein n=1 Tax=Thalassobius sp. I31.1 TaxID=2109912 RepID=UPI0013008535|nr:hypothetical protein [Thalassobius sp. I31.1]
MQIKPVLQKQVVHESVFPPYLAFIETDFVRRNLEDGTGCKRYHGCWRTGRCNCAFHWRTLLVCYHVITALPVWLWPAEDKQDQSSAAILWRFFVFEERTYVLNIGFEKHSVLSKHRAN